MSSILERPTVDGAVVAGAENVTSSFGIDPDLVDPVVVLHQGVSASSGLWIPDADAAVERAGHDHGSGRVPGDIINVAKVLTQRVDGDGAVEEPDLDGVVHGAGGEHVVGWALPD